MERGADLLQTRERLLVGRRFLMLRPFIAALGASGNAGVLAASGAPAAQRLTLALALFGTVGAFFVEAAWLRRRPLSERWLFGSLTLTLVAITCGTALSGGLASPLLPLFFAPVVVGFAAFRRSAKSAWIFGVACAALGVLALVTPFAAFPVPPAPFAARMLFVSAVTSLALLAVGVIGLVDAYTRVTSELERLRKDLLEEARRREKSVERLGAQVAHDVKNPLTAVRGLAQLALRGASEERDRERLGVVVAEVDRALALIGDYLSFTKPLSDLTLESVDVHRLFAELAALVEARAAERRVAVRLSGEPVSLIADRQKLRDALLNLVLNALTAMPSGGTLELASASGAGVARLSVADDGAGMDPASLARLGQAFASESEGGTGLGVLLARAVARQHGGELRFASEPGKGTCAVLELPLRSG